MMQFSFLVCSVLSAGALATAEHRQRQQGIVDPNTSPDCTFFDEAVDSTTDCEYFESSWFISHEQFVDWNPSVLQDCSGLKIGHSYCVEVNNGQPLPSSTRTSSSADATTALTATIRTTTSSTTADPPVDTCNPDAPQPVQPGAICQCTKWHNVRDSSTTCDGIIAYNRISAEDFFKWNSQLNRQCTNLWAGYNVCVGVKGSTTVPSTTTQPPQETCNADAPVPTQPGAVCGCTKWHLPKSSSTTCDGIIAYNHISADDFYRWNPKINRQCTNLWVGYNVCVGVKGSTTVKPTTVKTTTKTPQETCNPGAPQPVQPGAICRCKKWHLVKSSSTTCDAIIKYNKITTDNFYKWNPKINRQCTNLWQGYNVCVGA